MPQGAVPVERQRASASATVRSARAIACRRAAAPGAAVAAPPGTAERRKNPPRHPPHPYHDRTKRPAPPKNERNRGTQTPDLFVERTPT